MGFDKNGNWSSDFYPEQDRDNEVPITASKFQALIQENLKQSFQNCVLRDGSGLPTANISLNRKKITNLANGTSDLDAVNKSQLDGAMATNATEGSMGTVRIATEEETLKGEDDLTAISPLKAKKLLATLSTSTRFAVNSGKATDGKPDLLAGQFTGTLSFKVDGGTSYAPLIATTANAEAFSLKAIPSVDVSGLLNGTYNVFISPEGTAKVYANTIYRQQSQPTSMNTNDIWFNTCEPYKAFIKTTSGLVETNLVQIPQTIKIASNKISEINTIAYYNDNGNGNTRVSDYWLLSKAMSPDFTAGVSVAVGTDYTPTRAGWMYVYTGAHAHRGTVSFYVDNNKIRDIFTSEPTSYNPYKAHCVPFFVGEGHIYKFTKSDNGITCEITFYPTKGELK